MLALQSLVGLGLMIAAAWAMSENRRAVPWRIVAAGMALQIALALALVTFDLGRGAFDALNGAVRGLEQATRAGTSFVFGYLGGGDAPFVEKASASGFVLAFQAMPLVLVISALSALLFHWNVIPPIVRGFAWLLRRALGVDGPTGVAVAMNVFVGMVEAPLVVRPYLRAESRAALFVMMTAGMATVAGTVMVLYASFLDGVVPDPLGQILTASLISAPASIVIAFIMVPELPGAVLDDRIVSIPRDPTDNSMSAITRGALDGVQLLINIVAMLLVLVALVSLANQIIGLLPDIAGAPLTLQRVFGWAMAPLAWAMGLPASDLVVGGQLLGTKLVLTELIAYIDLSQLPADALSDRSKLILTYALCGFANFGALGIMIGGLVAILPERRAEIVELATKSLISGTLATCMTGAIVGLLVW
ncbi:MAG: nucleoside transporter C-terminal domain-containing protein [Rhodospirillaceae bacterium]|nr:nucleoside transporter C-terminal domain-containing protein [Rhodospirillaceae bacterium]